MESVLTTAEDVVVALGGTGAVARQFRCSSAAVSNWRKRGRLPATKFVAISSVLETKGLQADLAVWGMAEPQGVSHEQT